MAVKKTVEVTGPKRWKTFVAKEMSKKDGLYCWGLPHYGADVKLKVRFEKPGATRLFTENEVDPDEDPGFVPLAKLGSDEPQFLAVNLHDEACPVAMWEHEDGKFHRVWKSLDAFLAALLKKTDKTPYELLESAIDKADKLREKNKYAEALALVEAQLEKIPADIEIESDDTLAKAWNLSGICLEKLKRVDEALAAYQKSIDAGDLYAILNVLDLHKDAGDPRKVIAMGEETKRERYPDDYCYAWIRRYLAWAYLEIGEPEKAEAQLREILARFEITDTEKVREAREGLVEYIEEKKGSPGARHAEGFLAWFAEKSYDVGPEKARANRAWWNGLPPGLQAALKKETKVEKEPTDAQIARFFDVDTITLPDDQPLDDVSILAPFTRLRHLRFKGNPDSLEPLRPIKGLSNIAWNLTLLKTIDDLPPRADRDLLAAAESGDRAAMERALAKGADIDARDWHGRTALKLAMDKERDVDLALWLIERGADPWASNHHDSPIYFDEKDRPAIEAAARKAGMPPLESSPWRVLGTKREHRSASFDSVRNVEYLAQKKGESFLVPKPRWPKNARYDFSGNKKDDKLYDLHKTYEGFLVSERLRDWFEARKIHGLELLPVALFDRNGKARKERYFVLHPFAQHCLDDKRSHARYNFIDPDSIDDFAALVIDESKLDPRFQIFRVGRLNSVLVVMRRELADALAAGGFTGMNVKLPRR